jgi:hypothetical protein
MWASSGINARIDLHMFFVGNRKADGPTVTILSAIEGRPNVETRSAESDIKGNGLWPSPQSAKPLTTAAVLADGSDADRIMAPNMKLPTRVHPPSTD